MTDELDETHADMRALIADAPHNFTDTQGFIVTRIAWTMTEAAELLATHYNPDQIAEMSGDERAKVLADIISNRERQALIVSPIRDELLSGAPTISSYSGRTKLDTGQLPAVFADVPDAEDLETD